MLEQVYAEPRPQQTVEPLQRFLGKPSVIAYPEPVRVSLVLPIYNEGPILFDNDRNIMITLNQLGLASEILLCDYNSNDVTRDAAQSASSNSVVQLRLLERIAKA